MSFIGNFDDELSRSVFHNFTAMQRPEVQVVFNEFINKEQPSLVVEIGTAFGGLALALHNICNPLGIKFITYDIQENTSSIEIRKFGVDFRVHNIFETKPSWTEYTLINSALTELNSYPSPRLFLCDGGNKIAEYNAFAKILRPTDILMAHDYAFDDYAGKMNIENNIWAWKEIDDGHINKSMKRYNIEYYQMNIWEKLVWACTRKIS